MTNNSVTNAQNKITITDIAKDSGVSPATVSLVLRDKPGVGAKTRRRVMDSAQNLGYIFRSQVPNQSKSAIKSIGLIMKVRPNDMLTLNGFYAPVIAGIEGVCRQRGINMLYAHLPVDEDNIPLAPPLLLTDAQADGLLLVGTAVHEQTVAILQKQSAPVVLVDAYADHDPYDSVVTDNEKGAFTAVTHLIQNGHKQIAIVGSHPNAFLSIHERREGYIKAMRSHGLEPIFADCHLIQEEARETTFSLLQTNPEITAVFGCNDEVSVAIIKAAQEAGRQVPDDLSIIGFDNILLAQHITPALTTMQVDKVGMGRLAAQQLLNRIEFPESGMVRTVISPSLIPRQSVQNLKT